MPFSCGKNAIVQRAPDEADLSLFWMRAGRRRFQVCDGNGEMRISRGDSRRRGKVRDRGSAAEGAFAGRAARKSATHGTGGDSSRGANILCETTGRNARRKG